MRIGDAIRTIRTILDIPQIEVGKSAGLSVGFLSLIEANKRMPSMSTLFMICKAMEIAPSVVFILADSSVPGMQPYVAFAFKDLWERRNAKQAIPNQ